MKTPSPAAAAVLWALCRQAHRNGKNLVFGNRRAIGKMAGFSCVKRITAAMKELRALNLISYKIRIKADKAGKCLGKFYQISLRIGAFKALMGITFSFGIGAKNAPTVKRLFIRDEGVKRPHSSLEESGGALGLPPAPAGTENATAFDADLNRVSTLPRPGAALCVEGERP